jgi:light-regulated signal transduction histidine kinase (bacteriophytochrome)
MKALRLLAAALQRVVDRIDPHEGRYRMLFEESPLAMWVYEVQTQRFLAVNEAALKLYGYTREEFLGMSAQDIRVKKSGAPIEIETASHLVGWRGHDARLVFIQDVTERRRVERALERLNRELEDRVRSRTAQLLAANDELEAFSYSVSHDLRAPVRHIDGFVKLLERESPPSTEKAAHYLHTIAEASRRMGKLIDDLLALSRAESAPLETRSVRLQALVEEVLRDLRPDTGQRLIDWRIGALPAVHGDPSLLRVVLHNLLDNAVKYTRRRSEAAIEVGLERLDGGGAAVFVRDNGVGFDMRSADRLFGVFQRLHRDEDFEGTGIGLATARRIVHRHGGRIWGEGEPERGAVFRFTVEIA